MTDSATLKGDGFHIAQEISSRMKKELGITVSVGVSFNKIFAKLGSDYKKPDAITTMYEDEFQRKAWCLPVSDLLYVGNATNKKLYSMGIRTIGDLAKSDETLLVRKLGKMGSILWAFANGYDESPVKLENTSAPVKSVGNSTTTPRDMETDEDVKIVLYILAESVAARLRENGFRCRTVEISVRDKELFHFSKQVKLQNASNITKEIAEAGYRLYKDNYRLPADDEELKSSRIYSWIRRRITESVCMMRRTFLTSALDMPEIMSYIYSKSWKHKFSASSSIIIIEDYYLQTFLHSL